MAVWSICFFQSQITIGSNEKPNSGAILDLKSEADGTSKKGLLLPRVFITSIEPSNNTDFAASIGGSDSWDVHLHRGLIVYNTNKDTDLCIYPGVYYWSGTKWENLFSIEKPMGNFSTDVEALKELYNSNPGNTLGWNLSADPITWSGTNWKNVCGENRLVELDIQNKKISTSSSIEKLYALEWLSIGLNPLKTLDVSKNKVLNTLWCNDSQLTSLDISKNIALKRLWCYNNSITSLDVSNNINLAIFWCDNNKLKSLDISKNTALTSFSCSSNELTTLDTSKNPSLFLLSCSHNLLTSLDISKNTALTDLRCHKNSLTSLDISKNVLLKSVNCSSNKLATLDISTNNGIKELDCSYNEMRLTELYKIKNHPNYCNTNYQDKFIVTPQYLPGTTIDSNASKPTCP